MSFIGSLRLQLAVLTPEPIQPTSSISKWEVKFLVLVLRTSGLTCKPGCPVIRNAGGRANQSVVNDILVLDTLLGVTDVVVAHHTGLLKLFGNSASKTLLTVNARLWIDTCN